MQNQKTVDRYKLIFYSNSKVAFSVRTFILKILRKHENFRYILAKNELQT